MQDLMFVNNAGNNIKDIKILINHINARDVKIIVQGAMETENLVINA